MIDQTHPRIRSSGCPVTSLLLLVLLLAGGTRADEPGEPRQIHPAGTGLVRCLQTLGQRLYLSLGHYERISATRQVRKRPDPDADPHDPGLAVLTEETLDCVRRLQGRSSPDHEPAVAQNPGAPRPGAGAGRRGIPDGHPRPGCPDPHGRPCQGLRIGLALRREILGYRDRDADAETWAAALIDLAIAHHELGKRTRGAEARRHLDEAVAAYHTALEVFPAEGRSHNWAMIQNNLGKVLAEQGTHTGGEAGQALLAQALTAYRAALEVPGAQGPP